MQTTRMNSTQSQLTPGIWRLGSDFINYYALEESGRLTVVDAGAAGFTRTLEADLAATGFSPGDVEAIVLTYSDSDHTGVAPLLQRAGGRVLIHVDDEDTLRKPRPKTGDARPSRMVRELWRPRRLARDGHHGPRRCHEISQGSTAPRSARTAISRRARPAAGDPQPRAHAGQQRNPLRGARRAVAGDTFCTLNPMSRSRGRQLMPHTFNVSNAQARESLAKIEDLEAELVLVGHGEPWHEGPCAAVAEARAR
jgi:glyoxylase-like metal-dependent hydrolase (beta-lactamase superfamily II)